ncbi:MAG: hypothetical protein ABJE10_10355 [bacterium]
MRNSLRLSFGTFALALSAACSHSSEQPALSDDLKQDLAKAGGGDVQLAGTGTPKLEFVSASERTKSPTPSPKAPTVSRAPSASRGTKAVVKSVSHDAPAPAQPTARAEEAAPVEVQHAPPVVEPVPDRAGRPEAPRPSTQREPRGGWKTPGQVIRGAPFPINP